MSVVPLSELGVGLTVAQVQVAAQAGAAAAIAAACVPGGVIFDLINPANQGPFASGLLTGAVSYVLFAPQMNSYAVVSGIIVTTDMAVVLQFRNSGGATIGETLTCTPGTPLLIAPTSRQSYRSNQDEGLDLDCDNPAARLRASFWGGYS